MKHGMVHPKTSWPTNYKSRAAHFTGYTYGLTVDGMIIPAMPGRLVLESALNYDLSVMTAT
jgi:hypothetical protein